MPLQGFVGDTKTQRNILLDLLQQRNIAEEKEDFVENPNVNSEEEEDGKAISDKEETQEVDEH